MGKVFAIFLTPHVMLIRRVRMHCPAVPLIPCKTLNRKVRKEPLQFAEKLIVEAAALPQRLEAGIEKKAAYRSAEALRHPKSRSRKKFFSRCFNRKVRRDAKIAKRNDHTKARFLEGKWESQA